MSMSNDTLFTDELAGEFWLKLKDCIETSLGVQKVFCPKIADREYILTANNLNALTLSSYDTRPGTNVSISCLSQGTHKLNGSRLVTCLENGKWDKLIPTCIPRTPYNPGDVIYPWSTTQSPVIFGSTSYEMLPYLVGLAILAVTCIVLIILFTYAIRRRRYGKSNHDSMVYDNSSGTADSVAKEVSPFWIDLATPRNIRCHELADTHDSMVESMRYTQLATNWSGY